MGYLLQSKEGRCQKTRERYESAVKDPAFNPIRNLPLIHTTAETLYKVLKDSGKPCTNMFLQRSRSGGCLKATLRTPRSALPFLPLETRRRPARSLQSRMVPEVVNAFISRWSNATASERAKQFARAKPADVEEILQTLVTLGRAHRKGVSSRTEHLSISGSSDNRSVICPE